MSTSVPKNLSKNKGNLSNEQLSNKTLSNQSTTNTGIILEIQFTLIYSYANSGQKIRGNYRTTKIKGR
jgi:hypothetical protein